ncbi:hypothetical protein ACFWY5_52175 [Nonomuraea sp. NPDC059007]|uniref:hypothetical protein n=1 Tax=Nonomuraea sp. NPDC059007 TaxID=3346692 RepID=UPI0036C684E9
MTPIPDGTGMYASASFGLPGELSVLVLCAPLQQLSRVATLPHTVQSIAQGFVDRRDCPVGTMSMGGGVFMW